MVDQRSIDLTVWIFDSTEGRFLNQTGTGFGEKEQVELVAETSVSR
jgi:hypothetical protein